MQSNTMRVIGGIAVVAVAVVLLIVLRDDGGDDGNGAATVPAKAGQAGTGKGKDQGEPTVPTIVVRDGEPVGGILDLTFKEGDRIRFKVASNVSDEVHVHGYDIEKEVEAGGSVLFDFPATIEGGFETEMHHGGQIAELTVNP